MTQFVRILAVLVALVLSVSETIAGLAQEDTACSDATVDTSIKLCSVVIDNKKQTNSNRAYAFSSRCWAYNAKGNYLEAISDCSSAIRLNPKDDFAYAERCYAHIKYLDGFSEAIADCNVAIKLKPGSVLAHYNLALAYEGRNDLDQAIFEMSKAIKLKPKDKDTWDFRGSYYFKQKKYDLAISDFSEAIRLDGKFDEAFRERAEAKLAKRDLSGARSDIEKALSLNVGSPQSHLTFADIQLAENKAKPSVAAPAVPPPKAAVAPVIVPTQPTFADVQEEFRACVSAPESSNYSLCTYVIANPQQTSVSKALAYYYRASGLAALGRYKEVLIDSDQSIKLNPQSAGAFVLRSRAYGVQGEHNKAIEDADAAIKIDPKNALAFNERGWNFLRLRNYDLAKIDLNKAISLDPKYPNSYRHRAVAELALGDVGEARSDIEKALALKPDYVEAKQTLIDIAAAENKARQTIVVAAVPQEKVVVVPQKVIPVQPSVADVEKEFKACEEASLETTLNLCSIVINSAHHPASNRAIAFDNRCWAHNVKGDFDKALPDCDNAIGLNPRLVNAFNNRCWAYTDKRDFEKALTDCNEAIRLDQKNQSAWHSRGYTHFKKDEYELAIDDFDQAIRLDEKYPYPYRYRAMVKLLKNDLKSARADAEKAIALDPNYAEARQTLADIEAAEKKAQQAVPSAPPPPKPVVIQKRVALVIGNSAYSDGMALPNPTNDANAVAASLKRLGFEVVLATDATKSAMTDAMYRFAVLSDSADAALVFYAGHGMQVDGVNYLMPVDASLETRADLKHKFVSADEILDDLRSVKGMRMMVLDACRNNPLSRSIKLKLAKLTSRAVDNRDGLADMKAEGVLIAFATQPNEVAADGEGADSPFTLALLKHLETPGIEIDTMFKRVRTTVSEMTDGVQLPQTVNSSTGEFYLKQN
jgi:tetratricopeptide (TPR) repeat protein